ncbi:MAG: phage holin family protein, partial [Ottowia sp.]|nr:phage holin family protein [Ottowia sp.]
LGAMLAAFGVIFLALLITVWVWATHPLLALGVFTTLFLGGGVVLMFLARGKLRGLVQMFGVTREELRRDQDRLRGDVP